MSGERMLAFVLADRQCDRSMRDPFKYYDRLRRLQKYVVENIDKDICRQTAARVTCLSPGYFSTYFRSRSGLSFRAWLSRVRVRKATELLTQRDLTVDAVAEKVGFGSMRTLERHFKKNLGLTPREFKKTHMRDILSLSEAKLACASNIQASDTHQSA